MSEKTPSDSLPIEPKPKKKQNNDCCLPVQKLCNRMSRAQVNPASTLKVEDEKTAMLNNDEVNSQKPTDINQPQIQPSQPQPLIKKSITPKDEDHKREPTNNSGNHSITQSHSEVRDPQKQEAYPPATPHPPKTAPPETSAEEPDPEVTALPRRATCVGEQKSHRGRR